MHVVILAPGADTRVPVLECARALNRDGRVTEVDVLGADSDGDIDSALARAGDDPDQPHGPERRLIVAGGDGVLRAVLRRMVRHELARQKRALAKRTELANRTTRTDEGSSTDRRAGLAEDRTIADLYPIGLLPLAKAGELPDLSRDLDLPDDPVEVADTAVSGKVRRLDLFRNDRGSVTLHGVLLGGMAEVDEGPGRLMVHAARVNVDDTVLCEASEPLLACAIANGAGYSRLRELTLVADADPSDGRISVGVAVAEDRGIEVRRISGRTVRVDPVPSSHIASDSAKSDHSGVPFTDDGVDGVLRHACTWWIERGAWGLYMR